MLLLSKLTFSFPTLQIYTCANDHDVVNDRETALAIDPLAIFAHDIAVSQYGSLVHHHPTAVKLLRVGELIFREEIPG